jgi:glycosyltransferase involved in cell wall biosynthesis
MPQVSVIMAVHNGLPYLKEAVDSILNQTLADLEFIIVNDASSDATAQVIESYQDSRIRLVNMEKNIGQTAALNHGLGLATAPFIARQDADDVSKPDRLATQIDFLQQNPDHLLVGTWGDLIDHRGKFSSVSELPVSDSDVRQRFAEHNNAFFHGSVLFRREVLERVGLYREGFRTSQDYDYWLRISEHGKVANLPEPLYQYRLHEGQMTFTSYYRMKAEWKLCDELSKIRAEKGDDTEAYKEGAQQLKERFTNFTPTRAERRRAMAEFWRGKGVSYMNDGRKIPMYYCLLRAFLYEPNNPDFWRGVRNHLPI